MMTPPQQSSEDVKHEIQATLAARRELGPEYDDHFIDALAERITSQARRDVGQAKEAKPKSNSLSSDQRTGLAICSLIFGIPLLAIATTGGLTYVILVLAMIVLINAFAMR